MHNSSNSSKFGVFFWIRENLFLKNTETLRLLPNSSKAVPSFPSLFRLRTTFFLLFKVKLNVLLAQCRKIYSKGDRNLKMQARLEASMWLASKQPAPIAWVQSYPLVGLLHLFLLMFSSNNTDGLERSQNIPPEHLQTLELEANGGVGAGSLLVWWMRRQSGLRGFRGLGPEPSAELCLLGKASSSLPSHHTPGGGTSQATGTKRHRAQWRVLIWVIIAVCHCAILRLLAACQRVLWAGFSLQNPAKALPEGIVINIDSREPVWIHCSE